MPPGRQVEIKKYLEQVYDLRVLKVNTANYEGKVKRSKAGLYKRPDWKKAYVMLEVSTSGNAAAWSGRLTPAAARGVQEADVSAAGVRPGTDGRGSPCGGEDRRQSPDGRGRGFPVTCVSGHIVLKGY